MKSLNVSLLLTLILQVSHLPTLAADSESLPTVDHVFGVCALHKTIVVHAHGLADWAKTKSPHFKTATMYGSEKNRARIRLERA
jgi:hypothetical protein